MRYNDPYKDNIFSWIILDLIPSISFYWNRIVTGIHLRCGVKGISMRVFELHIAYTVLYSFAFRQRLDTNKLNHKIIWSSE